MPRGRATHDRDTLEILLIGYEQKQHEIGEKIRDLRGQLDSIKGARASTGTSPKKADAPKKRTLSAAARKRIAAAQRRRWAEHRKQTAPAE